MENTKDAIVQKLLSKSEELTKEKGNRYAVSVFIASAIASIVLTCTDDEVMEKHINDVTAGFSKQNITDAMEIVDIALSEEGFENNLSMFEAADIYFANPKEIEN